MAKPLPTGALLIKTKTPEQAIDLLKTEEFLGQPVTPLPVDRHNTVEAIAFVTPLITVPYQELVTELRSHGVIGVTRLRPKDGNPSAGLRFQFLGTTHPAAIKSVF